MNLEQLAYLAEIIAAIAVIASLIYVARQLQQTNEMMKVSASNSRVEREYDILNDVIGNREIAEIWCKGDRSFDSLDDIDQQRLIFFERRAIVLWHHIYSLRQQGLYSDEDWHWNEWIIQNIGRRQAIREAWNLFKGSYQQSFQNYIDGQFEIADANGSATTQTVRS
ncbi:MAG: hypothetical protein RLN82_02350 [Pseudomonadales bacterium]